MRKKRGEKILRPVHPNAGIRAAYQRKLSALVEEMATSYEHWILAQYQRDPPKMAMDVIPARELERELSSLGKQWARRYNEAAPKLARWFATSTERRSSAALQKILKDSGIAVEFQMSAGMKDVFQATVAENVGLIKSIASEYHTQVQGAVMRSVTAGRDLAPLAKELQERYGITARRAALISRDQNNKATASMTRVRQDEAGITKAVWLHSHGGKEPRKTHFANSGKTYDPKVGWFDPDPRVRRHIWPGELINCRCVTRSVVKGFE